MDPISYGVAAKQKQRIEKIIAEPDSTSGVITVPQVIATGEKITVPAGRTAILPNVRVDGELVVDGEVFIPSGSGYSCPGIEVDVAVVKQNGNVVANDIDVVHKTGDETIAGVKTFSSSPIVPNATTATQPIAYGQAVKLTGNETISGTKTFSNTIIGNISGTATTATNLSGGSVSGTTGSFSGVLSINSTTPTLINAGSNSSYGSGIKFLNNTYAHHSIGVKGSSFVISNTSSGPTGWDSPLDRLTIDSSGNATFSGTVSGTSFNSITALSSTTPVMNGTAAIGTSTTVARADHVHASDTSKASLSGATFTGAVSGTTFSATTFTGALSGNATTATTATNLSGGTVSATTGTFSGAVSVLSLTETSDRNFKDNIETLGTGLIDSIRPVSFNWKDGGKKAYGVIAQELEEVVPEAVVTSEEGVKSVQYTQLIPLLIAEVQTLRNEINILKGVK